MKASRLAPGVWSLEIFKFISFSFLVSCGLFPCRNPIFSRVWAIIITRYLPDFLLLLYATLQDHIFYFPNCIWWIVEDIAWHSGISHSFNILYTSRLVFPWRFGARKKRRAVQIERNGNRGNDDGENFDTTANRCCLKPLTAETAGEMTRPTDWTRCWWRVDKQDTGAAAVYWRHGRWKFTTRKSHRVIGVDRNGWHVSTFNYRETITVGILFWNDG